MPKKNKEATDQAKSNSLRRAARKAGRAAGDAEAGRLVDRFADATDDAAGLPTRRLKATTLPARLDRLFAETGATAPKKPNDLAEEYRVLVTQTAAIAARNIANSEERIAYFGKAEPQLDALVVRKAAKSSKNSDADLGPSPLAVAKADLLDARRFAAAVTVVQSQVLGEIVAITGQAPFQNWLARVWKDHVLYTVSDEMTIGDGAAVAAKSEITFSLLWELYLGAISATPAMRKQLKAAWNEAVERQGAMPTVDDIEAKLYAAKATERAEWQLGEDAIAAQKAEAQEVAARNARAITGNKLDRENVSS